MFDDAETGAGPLWVAGSYRDRHGRVFRIGDRLFRSLSEAALARMQRFEQSGLIARLVAEHGLVDTRLLPTAETPPVAAGASPSGRVLEHRPLAFLSHPYEWPFTLLKRAALAHLDLHLAALEQDATLVDGTAYNLQFEGARPVFIDCLSLVDYADGDPWLGYRQFCEQFLNPLLLMGRLGVPFHAWYRGELEGVPIASLASLLKFRHRLSPAILMHVVMHARFQRRMTSGDDARRARTVRMPLARLRALLLHLRNTIASLRMQGVDATVWRDYERTHSYDAPELEYKREVVMRFVRARQPGVAWDLGCNSGLFSEAALEAGARRVVGFDMDLGALEAAVDRSAERNLAFIPLYANALNPSPDQGWRQAERGGLAARRDADLLLALALLHHVVIGGNVPLEEAVEWLLELAPAGVVEFVPKGDPMVRQMLASREDIFDDYSPEAFTRAVERRARIVERATVSASGRELICYERVT